MQVAEEDAQWESVGKAGLHVLCTGRPASTFGHSDLLCSAGIRHAGSPLGRSLALGPSNGEGTTHRRAGSFGRHARGCHRRQSCCRFEPAQWLPGGRGGRAAGLLLPVSHRLVPVASAPCPAVPPQKWHNKRRQRQAAASDNGFRPALHQASA